MPRKTPEGVPEAVGAADPEAADDLAARTAELVSQRIGEREEELARAEEENRRLRAELADLRGRREGDPQATEARLLREQNDHLRERLTAARRDDLAFGGLTPADPDPLPPPPKPVLKPMGRGRHLYACSVQMGGAGPDTSLGDFRWRELGLRPGERVVRSDSPMEAVVAQEYLSLMGIVSTAHQVRVRRLPDPDAAAA